MAHEIEKTSTPVEAVSHALNLMAYLHAIRRRKSLMCLGIVIGLTLGALYYMRVPSVYESNARILITNKNSDVLQSDSRSAVVEDQVANQISMIRSPLIAKEAAENSKISLTSFGDKNPATRTGAILGGLSATRGDLRSGESTSVVILSYRTGNPSDSKTVLEAVLEAHKKVMADSYQNLGEETVELIERAKNDLTKQLDEKFKAYTDFRIRTLSPIAKDSKDSNEPERLMIGLDKSSLTEKPVFQARQEALLMREAEIRTHLKALEAAKKAGRPPAALLAMAERFSSASGAGSQEATVADGLLMLLGQEEELASTFGDDYAPLQRLRARIALVRSFLPTRKSGYPHNADLDPLERHIKELTEESECNKTMSEAYATLIGNQKDQLRDALKNELEDEKLHGDWLRTKQLWETTVKHLQEINLVKGMVGINTLVLADPTFGHKVAPILSTCLSLSLFAGILFGFGLVYLAEITDRSFKGPEDVVYRLGAPVIAHMPAIDYKKLATAADIDRGTTLSSVLCAYHRPKSRDAEAIRGIRTAIYFGSQGNPVKLIQFTSAQAGDGKSTLACNVALSIAQSGKRVIIVEADLRRPSFGDVFGRTPEVGFAQVLAGTDRWQDALMTFPEVPNLDVLPCGERPQNPAELLTGPLLAETLDQMKELYDYVIVDTPPLLPVTDPCSVAARADGVILVVQMGRNTRPNAERAGSLLETLGVRLLGIVMNRMTKDGGYGYGYGYGGYGYNYGGGYKYGGYGYRPDAGYYARGDAYYEEEHQNGNGVDESNPAKG